MPGMILEPSCSVALNSMCLVVGDSISVEDIACYDLLICLLETFGWPLHEKDVMLDESSQILSKGCLVQSTHTHLWLWNGMMVDISILHGTSPNYLELSLESTMRKWKSQAAGSQKTI